jgi:AraC family transcriptional regulator
MSSRPLPATTHGVVLDELRVDGLRVVLVAHRPGLCLHPHKHDTAKLCIVLDGAATELCGLDVLTPAVLDPVFRPAHVAHENQYHAPGARSLLVELDPADPRTRGVAGGIARDRAGAKRASLELVRACRAPRSSRARRLRSATERVLELFTPEHRRRVPSWLEEAREALAEEAAAPPTLAALARRLGVHPVYLAQSFRAEWGMTTRAFVRAHRVFRVMQAIDGGAGLAEAAAGSGFADQSHMTRAFRRERGAPPGVLLSARGRP